MSTYHSDAGIPVLTEVIAPSAYGVELPDRRATPRPPQFSPASVSEQRPGSSPFPPLRQPPTLTDQRAWIDADWKNAEEELSGKLLQQLMRKIDFVLEQRVRDSLSDVVNSAVETMAVELRSGLKEMLEDALSRALTQEVAKLKNQKLTGNHS